MPLEPLSHRSAILIADFPKKWLPLIHLYDPDLPLFPTCYFHVLPADLSPEKVPSPRERAYGFVDGIRPVDSALEVSVICNKDLERLENFSLRRSVELEIRERLGISNPVRPDEVMTAFSAPLNHLNRFLAELWNRVVSEPLGNMLPFGRFYDEVFGLVRMVSTFFPPAGRKSELIQTHYFLSKFGERIEITLDAPKVNFYLLPTYRELISPKSSLDLFPRFKALCDAVDDFCANFCDVIRIGRLHFSQFRRPRGERLNTKNLLAWIDSLKSRSHEPLIQCFNAFDKGPPRTILFILMLKDLKDRRMLPQRMVSTDFGLIYDLSLIHI